MTTLVRTYTCQSLVDIIFLRDAVFCPTRSQQFQSTGERGIRGLILVLGSEDTSHLVCCCLKITFTIPNLIEITDRGVASGRTQNSRTLQICWKWLHTACRMWMSPTSLAAIPNLLDLVKSPNEAIRLQLPRKQVFRNSNRLEGTKREVIYLTAPRTVRARIEWARRQWEYSDGKKDVLHAFVSHD